MAMPMPAGGPGGAPGGAGASAPPLGDLDGDQDQGQEQMVPCPTCQGMGKVSQDDPSLQGQGMESSPAMLGAGADQAGAAGSPPAQGVLDSASSGALGASAGKGASLAAGGTAHGGHPAAHHAAIKEHLKNRPPHLKHQKVDVADTARLGNRAVKRMREMR